MYYLLVRDSTVNYDVDVLSMVRNSLFASYIIYDAMKNKGYGSQEKLEELYYRITEGYEIVAHTNDFSPATHPPALATRNKYVYVFRPLYAVEVPSPYIVSTLHDKQVPKQRKKMPYLRYMKPCCVAALQIAHQELTDTGLMRSYEIQFAMVINATVDSSFIVKMDSNRCLVSVDSSTAPIDRSNLKHYVIVGQRMMPKKAKELFKRMTTALTFLSA